MNQQSMNTTKTKTELPEFITKLYSILENQDVSNIISWSNDGEQIEIKNQKNMQHGILTKYFRHNNVKSFIRQLNMYGFNKTNPGDRPRHYLCFRNKFFKRGQLQDLNLIKRKKKGSSESSEQEYSQGDRDPQKTIELITIKLRTLQKSNPQLDLELQQIINLSISLSHNTTFLHQANRIAAEDSDQGGLQLDMLQSIRDIPFGGYSSTHFEL